MAAIDTPPGLGLPGIAVGWFSARPGPRRLARRGLLFVIAASGLALTLTRRHPPADEGAARLIVLVIAVMVVALAVAVRHARIGIASDGVRWGWGAMTVRMAADRIASVRVYRDTIALVPRRRTPWFVAARDWDQFETMRRTVVAAGFSTNEIAGPAPWSARLQSYGGFLDGLVIIAVVVTTLVTVLAALG
jgi:hypothetical protein